MNTLHQYSQYWKERIEKDLAAFADPGTQVEVEVRGKSIVAVWESRSELSEASFSVSLDTGVRVSFRGQMSSYQSFLSSPEMADLRGLAKMILQSQKRDLFIGTKARFSDSDGLTAPQPAVAVLEELLSKGDEVQNTGVIFVTGAAGSGKTRVLQELVRTQAEKYDRGQTDCLYLYVNAQGRALARFNEALATELQDLRARVTYHAVSALVRAGVLVPVIDGFDELLGVGGYDDPFSSLAGFIEELDGLGQIVASARSTYYEQEFVARANSVSMLGRQSWQRVTVEVQSWGDEEFGDYINGRCTLEHLNSEETAKIATKMRGIFQGRNLPLGAKPLFVARTMDLVLRGVEFTDADDLRDQLGRAYLERERQEKLLGRQGVPLLSESQMMMLMTSVAEEMWHQETRELDRRSIREIAEYVVGTEEVAEATQMVVITRMPTLAFLRPGQLQGGIAFEHEMFFSYFLSRRLAEVIKVNGMALRSLLGRSTLPGEVAEAAGSLAGRALDDLGVLIQKLEAACAVEGPRAEQIRENAGALAAAALRAVAGDGTPIMGLRLRKIVFAGSELGQVDLVESRLEDVTFRRADLSRVRFKRCEGKDVVFWEVAVDPSYTRLELSGIDLPRQVYGLRIPGEMEVVYNPSTIRDVLEECGGVPPRAVSEERARAVATEAVELVERLVRAYGRANPVCTADDKLRSIFHSLLWPEIQSLLVKWGIVTREVRQAKGARKDFLRRQYQPGQIIAGASPTAVVPSAILRFWEEMERRFPAKE